MLNTTTPTHLQVAMPALSIQQQSWVVTETLWSTKLKIFAIWLFTERICALLQEKEIWLLIKQISASAMAVYMRNDPELYSTKIEGSDPLPLVGISVMELNFLLIDWIWEWWRCTTCEFPISACTMTWMVDRDSKWRKGSIWLISSWKKMNKKRDVDFGSVEFSLLCECYPLSILSIILLQYSRQDFIVALFIVIIICLETISQISLWTIYWQHLTRCLSNVCRRILYHLSPVISPCILTHFLSFNYNNSISDSQICVSSQTSPLYKPSVIFQCPKHFEHLLPFSLELFFFFPVLLSYSRTPKQCFHCPHACWVIEMWLAPTM